MNNLTKNQLEDIEYSLIQLITKHGNLIEHDSMEAIDHYIRHGEYEMAFEGFFLEMINNEANSLQFTEYVRLGIDLGLDKESVFDVDFWSKFIQWVEMG